MQVQQHIGVCQPGAQPVGDAVLEVLRDGVDTQIAVQIALAFAALQEGIGTRLQVTNVKTGRSVVVRVNDRGPFVQGRVVDVSYSAAQALGMVNTGVAPVKVNVVR